METVDEVRHLASAGRWSEVEAALAGTEDLGGEQLEILAEARWWSGQVTDSIALWERAQRHAYTAGDPDRATRLRAWIAIEYQALGNTAAASGWIARAEADAGGPGSGWLSLAMSATVPDLGAQVTHAARALELARRAGDVDLEIVALTRLGIARVRQDEFGQGLVDIDAGMAMAMAGEARRLRTVGQACCDLVLATELTGDGERLSRWMGVVADFVERHELPDILGFCATCCAGADAALGDFGGVEQQLRAAVAGLHSTGRVARCMPAAAKLAELLVLQGRLEEAEALLGADEDTEALLARARVALARKETSLANALAARVTRRLDADPLVRVAARAVLVDAQLAAGDQAGAAATATALQRLAGGVDSPRARARAAVSGGRVAHAAHRDEDAARLLESALDALAGVHGSLECADAHLDLAMLRRRDSPDVARAEARAAMSAYEAVGATNQADAAGALLRELGDRSRVGEKGVGRLTQREWEVLRLVAQGLSNAEIADRLYISTKTAGNHVSSILSKLGLRSRAEAASYATLHPTRP